MALPDFYRPEFVGTAFVPDVNAALAYGRELGLAPAEKDAYRVALVLVDMQVDFIHSDGSLYVPGAIQDTRRIVEWIYTHVGHISEVFASLDSHYPIQIFSSTWWQDSDGRNPYPYSVIAAEDVLNGKWQAIYEPEWSVQYVQQLEAQSKKQLMIWPYHTLIGTPGHNLTPSLYEAICYHTAARQSQPNFISKGTIPKTEHYSMLEPEVKVPENPQGILNTGFLEKLMSFDLIYIAGEAKSHCVLETVASMMNYLKAQPQLIKKLRVLSDGMSSVQHPEIDFDALADEAFSNYQKQGLTLVTSQDGID